MSSFQAGPPILSLFLAFEAIAAGAASAGPSTPAAPVPRILSVRELRSSGEPASGHCPDAAPSCSVDIASTLVITADLERLRMRASSGAPSPATLSDRTREARVALVDALASLERSDALSLTLRSKFEPLRFAVGEAPSAQDALRIRKLNAAFEKERGRAYEALLRYARAEPAQFGLDAASLANPDDALALINLRVRRDKLGEWIASRATELQDEAKENATVIRAASPTLLLRLGAFRIHRGVGVAVHLPGYDSIEARTRRDFSRITTILTDEQKARLDEERKFTEAVIQSATRVVSDGRKAAADVEQTRRELANGLTAARAELRVLLPRLREEVVGALKKLEGEIAANTVLAPQTEAVTAARAKAESLVAALDRVKATIEALQRASNDGAESGESPDLVLARFLGAVSNLQESASPAFRELLGLPEAARSLERAIDALAAQPAFGEALVARFSDLSGTVAQEVAPAVERVIAKSGNVGTLISDGGELVALLRNGLTQVANAKGLERMDLSSSSILSVPEDRIAPTDLDILRTDAEDGDSLEIVAEVRTAPDADPFHEERRSVTIRTFGWSSNVSGGLIFVKSIDVDTSNFKPEPVATWRIGYLPRPEDNSFGAALGRALRPGIGFHVATLDFSSDASVEMGAGVNVHLLADLVQVGYGWNLTVKEKRPYWYLGIGLFELLRVVQ
jgi:hypothetical protein